MLHLHFLQTTWSAVAWVICKILHQKIFHLGERETDSLTERYMYAEKDRERERQRETKAEMEAGKGM